MWSSFAKHCSDISSNRRHLWTCLLLDFLLVQVVIGPFTVAIWRGAWELYDELFQVRRTRGNVSSPCTLMSRFFLAPTAWWWALSASASASRSASSWPSSSGTSTTSPRRLGGSSTSWSPGSSRWPGSCEYSN